MKISRWLAASALLPMALGANALTTGDLAFTSFNADEDGWSLVALADIAANSTIYFSDNTYSAGAFANTESFLTWNTGASNIAAGTVVRFIGLNDGTDYTSVSASVGSLAVTVDGNAGLSATAETLYAYVGASHTAPVTFLAAVSSEATPASTTALSNAGLTSGINAVVVTNSTDYAQYTGARAGQSSFAGYAPLVNNAANWNMIVGGSHETAVPNTTAFTISEVPEPGALLLSMAGLGALGIARRRRT